MGRSVRQPRMASAEWVAHAATSHRVVPFEYSNQSNCEMDIPQADTEQHSCVYDGRSGGERGGVEPSGRVVRRGKRDGEPVRRAERTAEVSDVQRYGSGGPFEEFVGYSRVVRAGDFVFVSGCTSVVDGEVVHAGEPAAQTRQAIENVRSALARGQAARWPTSCARECSSPISGGGRSTGWCTARHSARSGRRQRWSRYPP